MKTALECVKSITTTIVPAAKIMNHAFCMSLKRLACIASLKSDIFLSKPLKQPLNTSSTAPIFIFDIFKILEANKLKMWIWNDIEKTINHIKLVLMYSNNLHLNESLFILYVSKTTLYLSIGFSLMNIDMLRCDRWSCCFKEMKMKNVVSVKQHFGFLNNSFTYMHWWACVVCFLKECNLM